MNCPRDQSELLHEAFWKYPRLACPQCQGVFVIERDLTEGMGHKGPKSLDSVAQVKVDNVSDSELRCPKDNTIMKAVHLANAELEVCPACRGLWLDHGEFEKIVTRMKERAEAVRPNPKLPEPERMPEPSAFTLDGVLDFLGGTLRAARIIRRILK